MKEDPTQQSGRDGPTDGTGQTGQSGRDRTGRTGRTGHNGQDKTGRTNEKIEYIRNDKEKFFCSLFSDNFQYFCGCQGRSGQEKTR